MWDQAGYYWGNLRLFRALQGGGVKTFVTSFLAFQDRSPLFNAAAVPFMAIFGENETAGMIVIWGSFVVLLIMVYRIGALCADKPAGALAALLTSCMPVLYGLSRQFLVEIPLAAVAAALAYFGLRADGFQKRQPTAVFGVLLGLGLLLKVTFLVYGAGIVGGVIWQRLREHRAGNPWTKKGVVDLLWMVVPALAIATPWYLSNFRAVIYFVTEYGYGRIIKLHGQTSVGHYYVFVINNGLSAYMFLSGVIALIVSLLFPFTKRSTGYRHADPVVVLAWFLVPLGIFSFATNPDIRHLAPVLPALGILISVWFSRIVSGETLRRGIAIYSILPLSLVVHLSFSDVTREWRLGPFVFLGRHNYSVYRPVVEDWKNEEVLRRLQGFVTDSTRQVNVALLADERYFEPSWLNFLSMRSKANLLFFGIPWFHPDFSLKKILQLVSQCDFLIMKSRDSESDTAHVNLIYRYNPEIRELVENGHVPFARLSDRTVLPDGSHVLVYQRTGNLRDSPPQGRPDRQREPQGAALSQL
jgi:hypothetical protein